MGFVNEAIAKKALKIVRPGVIRMFLLKLGPSLGTMTPVPRMWRRYHNGARRNI